MWINRPRVMPSRRTVTMSEQVNGSGSHPDNEPRDLAAECARLRAELSKVTAERDHFRKWFYEFLPEGTEEEERVFAEAIREMENGQAGSLEDVIRELEARKDSPG